MRVTFDYQIFSTQVQGGISRYFIELARRLNQLDGCRAEILAPAFVTKNLRGAERELLASPVALYDRFADLGGRPGVQAREASLRRRFNQFVSRRQLGRHQPDIFHETFFEREPLPLTTARRVLTCQDMIDERLLLDSGRTSQAFVDIKRAAIQRADHVLCSSAQTRTDLLNLVPIPAAKTTVVYLGCDALEDWPAPAGLADHLPPFVLFVGNRGSYKNFDGLLRAFARSTRTSRELTLVAFGGGALSATELRLASELGIAAGRLIQLDGDDQMLADLYRRATCCAYTSFYEGFGLIPLEAMTFGCPVVTTHGGSLKEVVGDAAEVVDPAESESIAVGLQRAVFDDTRRSELRTLGLARAKMFTWQRCAVETHAVYQGLV